MPRPRHFLLRSLFGHAALVLVSVMFVIPFAWLVLTSLKPSAQIFEYPPRWLPRPFTWSNYREALEFIPFLRYAGNTLKLALAGTFATLVSCSLVAYGISIVRWRGAQLAFVIMLSTVMLPPQVTMIPVFLIFKHLGWIGTYRPLLVPAFFASPFFVFMLRQFFRTIPRDLIDAARIDGSSHFEIYWRIVLPLSRPVLAIVVFFTFSAFWNDFMGPLIYLNDDTMYTLSLGLQQFLGQQNAKWDLLMAASTMMILPVIALFFIMQRALVEGINMTGLKG